MTDELIDLTGYLPRRSPGEQLEMTSTAEDDALKWFERHRPGAPRDVIHKLLAESTASFTGSPYYSKHAWFKAQPMHEVVMFRLLTPAGQETDRLDMTLLCPDKLKRTLCSLAEVKADDDYHAGRLIAEVQVECAA